MRYGISRCPDPRIERRTGIIGLALCGMGLIAAAPARAQVSAGNLYSQILNLWWGGWYDQAVRTGLEYRDRFGRGNLHVDYMIGTGACRVREYRVEGRRHLNRVLQEYADTLEQHDQLTIAIEIGKCASPWSPEVISYYRVHPASERWIGAGGAGWTISRVDPQGEDLPAIIAAAYLEREDAESILRRMAAVAASGELEVAPCGDFCGNWSADSAPADRPTNSPR